MKFELLVAIRYLKAKAEAGRDFADHADFHCWRGRRCGGAGRCARDQRGFREDLENKLLGAQAHVTLFGAIPPASRIIVKRPRRSRELMASSLLRRPCTRPFSFRALVYAKASSSKGSIPEMESRMSALSPKHRPGKSERLH